MGCTLEQLVELAEKYMSYHRLVDKLEHRIGILDCCCCCMGCTFGCWLVGLVEPVGSVEESENSVGTYQSIGCCRQNCIGWLVVVVGRRKIDTVAGIVVDIVPGLVELAESGAGCGLLVELE